MNKSRFGIWSILTVVSLLSFAVACNDEPPLPDNEVSFGATELGFSDDESQAVVTINLTRAVSEDKTLTISFAPTGVTYGVEFTTEPAAPSNTFTLTIPAGSLETSFTVTKAEGIFLEGDESIQFTIQSVDEPIVLSESITLNLSFSAIVSEGGAMQLQGLIAAEAGSSAGNSVFVDFSANQQSSVARTSWDIGFSCGDDFRVILNNTTGASAVKVIDTDLNQVTVDDITVGELAIGGGAGFFEVYDNIDGNLQHTAIDEISATDGDNKVYVINRIGGTGSTQASTEFVKIRVTRNGTGYTLEYAKLGDVTFQTVNIEKDAQCNFKYFHFDNGPVTVEPAKDLWEIEWTWSVFATNLGGGDVPYSFSDLVFINHHNGVKADTVFTADVTYADFNESHISDYDLVNERNVIGSGWRVTAPGGPDPIGVKTDRFYVVEDAHGNVYKLKFVNFHANDGGTRGKPNIEYALVKKGE